ncbi:MAG: pre-peptidase C-terminal domain-containing protein [Cyanobacteria bacterium P01_F01_bin.143]
MATVSLQTITGTFNGERTELRDTILAPELVESLGEQSGASLLVFSLQTAGEIPDGGVEVTVNSDIDLTEYFSRLGRQPFTIGGEVLEAVYDDDGTASGFRLRIDSPNAAVSLTLENEAEETDGPETATFTLEGGDDVDIAEGSATVTFYDSLETVPVSETEPQVSLTISETELIESVGNTSTLTFNVDGDIPEDGVLVYVNSTSGDRGDLGEFNVFDAEISGGTVPFANFVASGFYFKIFEDGASITLSAFDETTNPEIEEGIVEGIQSFTYELVAGPGYTIDPDAGSISLTIADNPDSVVIDPTEEPEPEEGNDLPGDTESNDTIATAVATGLSSDNPLVEISGELAQQRTPAVDRTEDVDMYSVELEAGDVLRLDTDARALQPSPLSPDTVLRIFDAEGNDLAQSDDDFAPDELFAPGRQDSYIEFTAETAGTYYVGVSSFGNGFFDFYVNDDGTLDNDPYDPNVAGSGTGRSYGEYNLNLSLNQEFTPVETVIPASTGDGPTVSLLATPATYDSDDNLIANALVQFTPEFRNASILTLGLETEGAIPEEGVEVYLTSNIDLSTVFSTREPFSPGGAQVLGAVYDSDGAPVGLKINLTSNSAILNLNLSDPEEAPTDGEETVTFNLEPSSGYLVGEDSFSTIIYDTLEDVPELPTVPTVGIALSETELFESEGNTTTLTFTLDTPPSPEGVTINLDSGERAALGEFDVFNAVIEGGSFPAPNFRASGFFFQMTEQVATITFSAFDETTNPAIAAEDALEGIEEFTFAVQAGVGYAIDPDASEVTVTIADNPDSVILDPDAEVGSEEEPAIPFEEESNDTIATATDTGLSLLSPNFLLQAEIDSTRATRNLIDATEDVDIYAFNLEAGESVTIDVDSIPFELEDFTRTQRVDTELRIFNEAGEELLLNTEDYAPDEVFASGRDPYVEFTATEAGTYYAGVAMLSNRAYDPNIAGSGSGRVFPDFGINLGEYTIEFNLITDSLTPTQEGTAGDDELSGSIADDVLSGLGGDDSLFGNGGSDVLLGGAGNDELYGESGDDTLLGGPGDDLFYGNNGNDIFTGGSGNDEIFGGEDSDVIFAGDGDDTLLANDSRDVISGDDGNDLLFAGGGDDILMGVTGDDELFGGAGSDLFVFGNGDGTDTIFDFETGIDQIGLVEGELVFADLTLSQDGENTLLGVADSGETLAVLKEVEASSITEDSFVIVPDVSNPDEALALI